MNGTEVRTVSTTTSRSVYVEVDLAGREVVGLYRERKTPRAGAYILDARFDRNDPQHSRIILSDDASEDGEQATEIALASQGIGLGWTFATECGYCDGLTTSTSECTSCGIRP